MLLTLGMVLTLIAWGVLVFAAIDFGGDARSGDATGWVFMSVSAVGAAACLFLTLILGSRLLSLARSAPAQARPLGGRRALR